MRRAVLIGLVAVLALPGADAFAANVYTVESGSLYVRNKASGYVIGTLRTGDRIDVQRTSRRRWGYGLVYGEFGNWGGRRCGWVQLSGLRRAGQKAPSACPRPGAFLRERRLFQRGSYIARAGTGAVRPINLIPCPSSTAFGNYDPLTRNFATGYGAMPTGRGPEAPGFGLRYVTADGTAALLKDTGNPAGAPAWFFMPAACVERLPVRMGEIVNEFATSAFGDATVRPSALQPYKDSTVLGLRWQRFSALRAVGRGTARVNSCRPICANGRIYRRRGVRVTLSAPRVGDCGGTRAFVYTQASIRWPRIRGVSRARTSTHGLSPSCASAGQSYFCDEIPLSFTTGDLIATRVRCSKARRVFRAAVRQRNGRSRFRVRGFTCRFRTRFGGLVNEWTCRKGRGRFQVTYGD